MSIVAANDLLSGTADTQHIRNRSLRERAKVQQKHREGRDRHQVAWGNCTNPSTRHIRTCCSTESTRKSPGLAQLPEPMMSYDALWVF